MKGVSMLAAGALALLAVGCGGSGDPRRQSAFVLGTVGAAEVLTVNGTAFRTRGAVLRLLDDGTAVTLASEVEARTILREGMVVAVKGATAGGAGTAAEILYRAVLRGPLVGRGESLLAVAGADVAIDASTVVLGADGAPTTLDALPAGGRVEVSGWPEDGTRVRATLVRALAGDPPVVVRGWSLGVPAGGTFDLSLVPRGAPLLAIGASGASGPPVPADALVCVDGTAIAAGAPPVLAATAVRVEAQLLPQPGDAAAVEGVVTGSSADELVLGEHRVRSTAATVFEGMPAGSTAAVAVGPGTRLVAVGVVEGPRLVADRIRLVALHRVAGRIVPGSLSIGQPATYAAVVVAGTDVVIDARTRALGPAGEPLTILELAALHSAEPAGLPVVVHGYERQDGVVLAHRVDVTGG